LTPSDKIDIKALPAIDVKSGSDYTAPRNELEEELAGIWSEVLGVSKEKIGVNDSYFDLGGNSLKVIEINTKVKSRFNRDIPVVAMFRYTSIGSFAEYLIREEGGGEMLGKGIIEDEKLNKMDESMQEALQLFE
jgi:acyl carrier protein